MTIRDAAIEVLVRNKRPMRCGEIAGDIKDRKLHPLPTQYPSSVVNKAIRRHCQGVVTDGSQPKKYFKALPNNRYTVLEPRPQF